MKVFEHPEFDRHEHVAFAYDDATGLRAIIALHSTALGPGLGGCRVYPYADDEQALTDVLRLSRGMTYKAALAGLDQGGGKSVVIADPRQDKTPALMQAMGAFVESLGGRYLVAEDSGTNEADMRAMATRTTHVAGGAAPINPDDPGDRDTSAATALGVLVGIEAAVRFKLGRDDLKGLRVAIQGVGKVGQVLAGHLHEAGAELYVSDAWEPSVEYCAERYGAVAVPPEEVIGLDVDVFSPCALGAILDDQSIPRLRAGIIAGAANNQLAEPRHGEVLRQRGVLYAPDYAINAGGIINLYYTGAERRWAVIEDHVRRIGPTLSEIFERAAATQRTTESIADAMAEARFRPSAAG